MNIDARIDAADLGLSRERLDRIRKWMQLQVDERKLPGAMTVIWRNGEVAFSHACGLMDVERNKPLRADTIFRIYSQTKAVVSVAIMMLYEEGRFQLDDPIARFVPAFRDMRVFTSGARGKFETEPARRGITFRDLLTHTSGLTYGFMEANPVDAAYRQQGIDFAIDTGTLAEMVEKLAALPLIAHPGEAWNYSVATDVLGYLVEVVSGQPLETFLRSRIFAPLGMSDTGFHVPDDKLERFAACYNRGPQGGLALMDDPHTSRFRKPRTLCSGGGGLVSTAADYLRFCRMLMNMGELDGARLLGRKTVELMTSNHLGGDLADMGMPRFSESTCEGIGFGLGFSVMIDPAKAQILGTAGEYAWSGVASTAYWCDPAEQLITLFMTQLHPSSTYPLRRELRVLVYQSIVD
jgi:CubicO group peptidase (beta-lactamase class C family)